MNANPELVPTDLKICVFLPSLAGGGAERVMARLTNEFSHRGFEVDLVLAHADGPYLSDLSDKVNLIDLECSGVLSALPKLIKYLNKHEPNSLLTAMNHSNIVATVATIFSRSKVRLILSERLHFGAHLKRSHSLKEWIVKCLMHFLYRRADKIICVSKEIEHYLLSSLNLDKNKITTIYNPVVDQKLIEDSHAPNSHQWLQSKDLPVIVSAGRLNAQKNQTLLIDAFHQLIQTKKARLIIFGEGELRHQLEQQIKDLNLIDHVLLPGFESNLFSSFRKADLFVLSSDYEGLPGVLIQAMACGLPIVSTDCPTGPAEILEQGKWGELVPVGDRVALSNAIATALDKTSYPAVEERAQFFNVETATQQYLKELIPNHPSTL